MHLFTPTFRCRQFYCRHAEQLQIEGLGFFLLQAENLHMWARREAQNKEYGFETLCNGSIMTGLQSPFCGNFTGYQISRKEDKLSTSTSAPLSCHPLHKVFRLSTGFWRPYEDGDFTGLFFFFQVKLFFGLSSLLFLRTSIMHLFLSVT